MTGGRKHCLGALPRAPHLPRGEEKLLASRRQPQSGGATLGNDFAELILDPLQPPADCPDGMAGLRRAGSQAACLEHIEKQLQVRPIEQLELFLKGLLSGRRAYLRATLDNFGGLARHLCGGPHFLRLRQTALSSSPDQGRIRCKRAHVIFQNQQ